jgi:hypothetical protein
VNPRTVTWALGAVALALTVALAVSLCHRQPATDTAQPAPPSSQAQSTADPTVQATEPAAENGPTALPISEVEAHDARPGTTPYSQTDEARRGWGPVATGFGKAFTTTQGKNAAAWQASLAPFVTDKVKNQLATVALANVPAGTFERIEPAEFGEDKIAVFVHYDTGLTLVTYLILDGTSWRIYAYDRWEG